MTKRTRRLGDLIVELDDAVTSVTSDRELARCLTAFTTFDVLLQMGQFKVAADLLAE